MTQQYPNALPHLHFTARNDYAFKKLFGTEENKDIIINFVSLVTGIKKTDFHTVAIENSEVYPTYFDKKAGQVDIKINLADGRNIHLEMRNIYSDHHPQHSIFYWSELLRKNVKKVPNYTYCNKYITINIVNRPFQFSNKLHAVYKIQEIDEQIILDEMLEIHFLDLTKIPHDNLTVMEKWLMFIKTESPQVRAMLAKGHPLFAKANQIMNRFYLNDHERTLYRAACRYGSDRISVIHKPEHKGIAQSYTDSAYHIKLETAKKLKQLHCDRKIILQATGLSHEDIERL